MTLEKNTMKIVIGAYESQRHTVGTAAWQRVTMISAAGVGIWELDGFSTLFPSGYVKIAIENDHRNSGFPHETWILSIVM